MVRFRMKERRQVGCAMCPRTWELLLYSLVQAVVVFSFVLGMFFCMMEFCNLPLQGTFGANSGIMARGTCARMGKTILKTPVTRRKEECNHGGIEGCVNLSRSWMGQRKTSAKSLAEEKSSRVFKCSRTTKVVALWYAPFCWCLGADA
ncbi:hypothetical protein VNO80_24565 [Phaseolus coccineus]|uniref:Uncharacterized protein n=1 Tax=Phaseolus coccineus TaxID=3886 RepID=A0AAN9QSH1_PHACN